MSRRILGYEAGKPIWSENDPSSVHASGYLASQGRGGYAHIAGELVQGDPGATERQRESQRKHKARKKA